MSGLRAILLAAAIVAAGPVYAADWDATWVGGFEDGGDGVQVIVAGDTVLGFFLGGDYVDVTDVGTVGTDGSLAFKWEGGEGALSGTGDDRILTIRTSGTPNRVIKVAKDH